MKFIKKIQTINTELRTAVIIFLLVVITGAVSYHFLEGWNLLDSVYFSVMTLSTVGYGDMHPTHPATKLFTIFYVLIGVGLMFYILTSLTRHMFESEKKDIARIEHEIEHIEQILDKKSKI